MSKPYVRIGRSKTPPIPTPPMSTPTKIATKMSDNNTGKSIKLTSIYIIVEFLIW